MARSVKKKLGKEKGKIVGGVKSGSNRSTGVAQRVKLPNIFKPKPPRRFKLGKNLKLL